MGVVFPENRGDAERDLRFQDAKHFQKAIEGQFVADKDRTTWGVIGWLDDEDWKTSKRKVFRMEGAVKREKDALPVYIDFYLVSELNSSRSFMIEAWMGREGSHVAFRKDVEDIIRSFQWSVSPNRSPSPSTGPGATPVPAGTPGAAAAPPAIELPPLTPAGAPNTPQQ